jgi:aminopeptidase
MTDPRWAQLADILIRYSTATQPGDRVLISMVEPETFPLVRAVHAAAVRAGASPYVELRSALFERDLMRFGTLEQVGLIPEIQAQAIDWADVYINVRGVRSAYELSDQPSEKFVALRRAMGGVSAMRTEKTRWIIVRPPGEAFAQQAGMSIDEAEELFFAASLRDWRAESAAYRALMKRYEGVKTVRIVGEETDLTFSTRGRTYGVADGHVNMPDGEIFTAPVEDSVEGRIYFDIPGVFFGQQVSGIRLTFEGGCVVKATAESNEALLHQLLEMDEGARRVGEFGIGTNTGITRACADHFWDEKISGTIHLALGRSYKECGGLNDSALHWDIVKDLRHNAAIYLDGALAFENGQYV